MSIDSRVVLSVNASSSETRNVIVYDPSSFTSVADIDAAMDAVARKMIPAPPMLNIDRTAMGIRMAVEAAGVALSQGKPIHPQERTTFNATLASLEKTLGEYANQFALLGASKTQINRITKAGKNLVEALTASESINAINTLKGAA